MKGFDRLDIEWALQTAIKGLIFESLTFFSFPMSQISIQKKGISSPTWSYFEEVLASKQVVIIFSGALKFLRLRVYSKD